MARGMTGKHRMTIVDIETRHGTLSAEVHSADRITIRLHAGHRMPYELRDVCVEDGARSNGLCAVCGERCGDHCWHLVGAGEVDDERDRAELLDAILEVL